MNVTLLAYRNMVLVIPDEPIEDPTWSPAGHRSDRIQLSSTVLDTRANLQASMEALDLLRSIRVRQSFIGDWSWQQEGDRHTFTWLGPLYRILNPTKSFAARDSKVFDDEVTLVSNTISSVLAAEVDAALAEGLVGFRVPFTLDDPILEN